MEDRGADDAVLPPTGGVGSPGRVHELGSLESQGFTLRSGNIMRGAPPPLCQINVPQITEVPVDPNAVARGGQAQSATDVTIASSSVSQIMGDVTMVYSSPTPQSSYRSRGSSRRRGPFK